MDGSEKRTYRVRAVDEDGNTFEAEVRAGSEEEAISGARARGLIDAEAEVAGIFEPSAAYTVAKAASPCSSQNCPYPRAAATRSSPAQAAASPRSPAWRARIMWAISPAG